MLDAEMTDATANGATIHSAALDDETRTLVRLSALISAGSEAHVREALVQASAQCRAEWVEEVMLQSYLFAGFRAR